MGSSLTELCGLASAANRSTLQVTTGVAGDLTPAGQRQRSHDRRDRNVRPARAGDEHAERSGNQCDVADRISGEVGRLCA